MMGGKDYVLRAASPEGTIWIQEIYDTTQILL